MNIITAKNTKSRPINRYSLVFSDLSLIKTIKAATIILWSRNKENCINFKLSLHLYPYFSEGICIYYTARELFQFIYVINIRFFMTKDNVVIRK